jgi:putative Holliday junction resolvase
MNRYISLDLGEKRTGVALVDDVAKVATPLTIIKQPAGASLFIDRLRQLINEWEPAGIICGIPIDLKGREAIAAENVRTVMEKILKAINKGLINPLEVHYIDERLTTAQAERTMLDQGVSAQKRKEMRDALAAAVIAQTYIDTL